VCVFCFRHPYQYCSVCSFLGCLRLPRFLPFLCFSCVDGVLACDYESLILPSHQILFTTSLVNVWPLPFSSFFSLLRFHSSLDPFLFFLLPYSFRLSRILFSSILVLILLFYNCELLYMLRKRETHTQREIESFLNPPQRVHLETHFHFSILSLYSSSCPFSVSSFLFPLTIFPPRSNPCGVIIYL